MMALLISPRKSPSSGRSWLWLSCVWMAMVSNHNGFVQGNRLRTPHKDEDNSNKKEEQAKTKTTRLQEKNPLEQQVVLAGLLHHGAELSTNALAFLQELACNHAVPIFILGATDMDLLHEIILRQDMAKCAPVVLEKQPDLITAHSDRVQRIQMAREYQRSMIRETKSVDRVILADLDVSRFPAASLVVQQARNSNAQVLCAAGLIDVSNPSYYDTFATVLLPDTFVYPVEGRPVAQARPEEDPTKIIGNGFSGQDLYQWFVQQGKHGSNMEPVPVGSCFGGLAIYDANLWLDETCSYRNDHPDENVKYANKFDGEPCEHVVLHNCIRSLIDPQAKIAVQPDMNTIWHPTAGLSHFAISHHVDMAKIYFERRGIEHRFLNEPVAGEDGPFVDHTDEIDFAMSHPMGFTSIGDIIANCTNSSDPFQWLMEYISSLENHEEVSAMETFSDDRRLKLARNRREQKTTKNSPPFPIPMPTSDKEAMGPKHSMMPPRPGHNNKSLPPLDRMPEQAKQAMEHMQNMKAPPNTTSPAQFRSKAEEAMHFITMGKSLNRMAVPPSRPNLGPNLQPKTPHFAPSYAHPNSTFWSTDSMPHGPSRVSPHTPLPSEMLAHQKIDPPPRPDGIPAVVKEAMKHKPRGMTPFHPGHRKERDVSVQPPRPMVRQVSACTGLLSIAIVTDEYNWETSWALKAFDGTTVLSSPSYEQASTTYIESYDLEDLGLPCGKYTFTIYDDAADGLCCIFGFGSYRVVYDGEELASGGEFRSFESTTFNIGQASPTTSPAPAPMASCQGNCGGWAFNGVAECYCGSECTLYGNCCDDFSEACHIPSCQGSCGQLWLWLEGEGPLGCSCHGGVCGNDWDNAYCCPDFDPYCPREPLSCKHSCGAYEVCEGFECCSCSLECVSNGNCCEDFSAECPMPSCQGNCGGGAFNGVAGCYCDSECTAIGDCCPDYEAVCNSPLECICDALNSTLIDISFPHNMTNGMLSWPHNMTNGTLPWNETLIWELCNITNAMNATNASYPNSSLLYSSSNAMSYRRLATSSWTRNLVDFLIAGFPKTGTTTLLHALGKSKEASVVPTEHCTIAEKCWTSQEAQAAVESAIATLPKDTLHGIKCPVAIGTTALSRLAKHSPRAKIIVGVRHPVLYFQSYYNYRVTELHDKNLSVHAPPAETLIGNIHWLDVSTEGARFEQALSTLYYTDFEVFFYSLEQIEDADAERKGAFETSLTSFLGLEQEPLVLEHANKNHFTGAKAHPESIRICDTRYKHLRNVLVENGKATKDWLVNVFMKSEGITVANKDHFMELIEKWGEDPCDSVENADMYKYMESVWRMF